MSQSPTLHAGWGAICLLAQARLVEQRPLLSVLALQTHLLRLQLGPSQTR